MLAGRSKFHVQALAREEFSYKLLEATRMQFMKSIGID